jgi:hypothetical protein
VALTRVDRQRLQDSRLRIQSIVSSLGGVDADKVPNYVEIHECLRQAERNIEIALNAGLDPNAG